MDCHLFIHFWRIPLAHCVTLLTTFLVTFRLLFGTYLPLLASSCGFYLPNFNRKKEHKKYEQDNVNIQFHTYFIYTTTNLRYFHLIIASIMFTL